MRTALWQLDGCIAFSLLPLALVLGGDDFGSGLFYLLLFSSVFLWRQEVVELHRRAVCRNGKGHRERWPS